MTIINGLAELNKVLEEFKGDSFGINSVTMNVTDRTAIAILHSLIKDGQIEQHDMQRALFAHQFEVEHITIVWRRD